jgi:hypothetical protein
MWVTPVPGEDVGVWPPGSTRATSQHSSQVPCWEGQPPLEKPSGVGVPKAGENVVKQLFFAYLGPGVCHAPKGIPSSCLLATPSLTLCLDKPHRTGVDWDGVFSLSP